MWWGLPPYVLRFDFLGSKAQECAAVRTDKELSTDDGESVGIAGDFMTPCDFPGVERFCGNLVVSAENAMCLCRNGCVGKFTGWCHRDLGGFSLRAALGGGELAATKVPPGWNEELVAPLGEVALR